MAKEIFIVIMDRARLDENESEITVLKASADFNDALATYKENIDKARAYANEMGYTITESVGDLTKSVGNLAFISYSPIIPGCHYNISLVRQSLSGEDKKDIGTKMSDCLDTLRSITTSGYWPYRSPAPCSTEVNIKKNLDRAIDNLSLALSYHEDMFGKTGRNPMECGRSVIK